MPLHPQLSPACIGKNSLNEDSAAPDRRIGCLVYIARWYFSNKGYAMVLT